MKRPTPPDPRLAEMQALQYRLEAQQEHVRVIRYNPIVPFDYRKAQTERLRSLQQQLAAYDGRSA